MASEKLCNGVPKQRLDDRQSMEQMDQRLLSTQELGTLLGVTRQTIRNWIKRGEVRAFHIGQNLKIPNEEAVRILRFYGLPVPDGLPQGDGSTLESIPVPSTRPDDSSEGEPEELATADFLDKDCGI